MKECLDSYHQPFKEVVLPHLSALPPDEWKRLRAFAANRSRHVNPKLDVADLEATPQKLVDDALSEDSISVDQFLETSFRAKATEIGSIKGQPVYYVNGQGIYLWGLEPKQGFTLAVWVTHPAYPPSW